MSNRDKLKQLLLDVFLLSDEEFSFELRREEIETWDSLGVVCVSAGVQEVFGYLFTPEQAIEITSIPDIMRILSENSVSFDE